MGINLLKIKSMLCIYLCHVIKYLLIIMYKSFLVYQNNYKNKEIMIFF